MQDVVYLGEWQSTTWVCIRGTCMTATTQPRLAQLMRSAGVCAQIRVAVRPSDVVIMSTFLSYFDQANVSAIGAGAGRGAWDLMQSHQKWLDREAPPP